MCNSTDGFRQEFDEHGNKFEIVSKVAYLLGVPTRIFESEYDPPKMDVYEQLQKNKHARIIRHLCILRTAFEQNYKNINEKIRTEHKSILSLPEYIPTESLNALTYDGVTIYKKSNTQLIDNIIEVNRIISDRINNCKPLFPTWINWEYIKALFIMPDGLTEAGTKAAANLYYANKSYYPYQVYMNWIPENEGNIFHNDKKFATLLYEWNNNGFTEFSKVSDVSRQVKGSIFEFIDNAEKVLIAVDCENSDPYRLAATLKYLDIHYKSKIKKIILFDDVHTVEAWKLLESYTDIPVERIEITRVKEGKSLVDQRLGVRVTKEVYKNDIDSVILVASDSDYWAMIDELEDDIRFMVMVEREKTSGDLKEIFLDSGIFYCYIEDFYSGDAEEIKTTALFRALAKKLTEALTLNAKELLDEALVETRINMDPAEKKQFYDRHIRNMSLAISEDGAVKIVLKR